MLAGLRGVGVFWACLLALAGAGAATLQWLGPPHPAVEIIALPAPDPVPDTLPADPPAPRVADPDPALLEPSAAFPPAQLPRVGPDGRTPAAAYAAPVPSVPAGHARVAILLAGFGLSERDSRTAVEELPGPVSFAVSAYAAVPKSVLGSARAAGHELFASIPMEPQGYPLNDEGPRALLGGLSPEDNRRNLEWALSRTQGAVGATGASDGLRGERFADLSAAAAPALAEIGRRGLLYVDPRPGQTPARAEPPVRGVDVVLDDSPARAEIAAKLAALERVARDKGAAIGLAGRIRPVTTELIAAWARTLAERGFALVPVSALVAPAEPPR